MDGDRFDALSRRLAERRSRRAVVAALTAAVLGAVGLAENDRDRADAAPVGCKAAGKNCTKPGQCCPGLVCAGGRCVVPPTPTSVPPTPTAVPTEAPPTPTPGICAPVGAACLFDDPGACCNQTCCAAAIFACPPGVDPCCC